jgi:hypothetical protein
MAIEARSLVGRRALVMYLLAAAPVLMFALRAVFSPARPISELAGDEVIFAALFRTVILRFVVFFGCVAIFTRLFRGEVIDRSLHFYFLAPMHRPVLVVGKFLAGLVGAIVLFSGTTVASWILCYVPLGGEVVTSRLTEAGGLAQLAAYVGVTMLACVGYGALFLLIGVIHRSPIVWAVIILVWEGLNALLPPLLKKISVIHYLDSLCPVALPTEQIAILADPAPASIAVPGILGVATVLLVISSLLVRRMEILYGAE